jgi:hypothetical protein
MQPPAHPKIYHILHIDRLPSVISDGHLFSDAIINQRPTTGTVIGISRIKERRLKECTLNSYPDLHVGDCVPFYFCPRSIMLYKIFRGNDPELSYKDGQRAIVHLELDLKSATGWGDRVKKRWAITKSNASSAYFEDFNSLTRLDDLNWQAIHASYWQPSEIREPKQAEFLIEEKIPWELVDRIGVHNADTQAKVKDCLTKTGHRPPIEIKLNWYY